MFFHVRQSFVLLGIISCAGMLNMSWRGLCGKAICDILFETAHLIHTSKRRTQRNSFVSEIVPKRPRLTGLDMSRTKSQIHSTLQVRRQAKSLRRLLREYLQICTTLSKSDEGHLSHASGNDVSRLETTRGAEACRS